jgi:acyl carrier protein
LKKLKNTAGGIKMRVQEDVPNMQTMRNEIRNFIISNFLSRNSEGGLHDDDLLFESAIIDSAGAMTFIFHLEGYYGIQILDEELFPENFASVNHILQFLKGKLGY